MKVNDNVLFWSGMYAGSGFVFAGKGIVAIDSQSRRDQADLMLELLKLYRLDQKNLKYMVYTHNDFDHIGGNAEFIERIPGIKIVADIEDASKIENLEKREGGDYNIRRSGFYEQRVLEHLKPSKVQVKVDRDMTLDADNLRLKIIRTPGHTVGSISIYHEESESLFSGDTVIGGGLWAGPRGIPLVRTDFKSMVSSLEKLRKLEVEWLLPGHGRIIRKGKKRIEESLMELKKLPAEVLSMLEKELSVSEISDELLVYPETISSVISMLEKDGRVKKIEEERKLKDVRWIAI